MRKDLNTLLTGIRTDISHVESSIDVLAVTQVFTYAYLLLCEKTWLSPTENKSDFLAGAYSLINEIQNLPTAIKSIK